MSLDNYCYLHAFFCYFIINIISIIIIIDRTIYNKNIFNFQEKYAWRRYVYLWINYALFEELETGDEERTRDVYQTFITTIPHKLFTFSKAWLYYAQFEIRHKNLAAARKRMVITNL